MSDFIYFIELKKEKNEITEVTETNYWSDRIQIFNSIASGQANLRFISEKSVSLDNAALCGNHTLAPMINQRRQETQDNGEHNTKCEIRCLTAFTFYHNYNKILESDWLSAGPIRTLRGQFVIGQSVVGQFTRHGVIYALYHRFL